MRQRVIGRDTAGESEGRNGQSKLPALLLPQPKPPRIDDPDRGKAPVGEPGKQPPPQEVRGKPDPDSANPKRASSPSDPSLT